MVKSRLAIFASGQGSNALNLIEHFKNEKDIEIGFVLTNKSDAPVIQSAREKGVEVHICSNTEVQSPAYLKQICEDKAITHIILAGFLRKIPQDLVTAYNNRIINIHPALLPKYGGEGMYGKFVHQAVLEHGDLQTGISIHLVNEEYDKGEILAQFSCPLTENETVESIQEKIQQLEKQHFPKTVAQFLTETNAHIK